MEELGASLTGEGVGLFLMENLVMRFLNPKEVTVLKW
ncbi:hypothetical protein BAU18_000802 [Enterococcus diestrammenae]|uniref:Histidine kinase/HSP90-like ATPase domain-containing protein n=1 Tax=Enterococcus diestrammenae TaxID=1155073 RepID=A0ABV0F2I0_9ENTE